MAVTVYGIPNCDTVKKARKWLDANGVEYEFHDYKKLGIDAPTLKAWSKIVGWESLVNKRGTTFRKLPENDKETLTESKAIKLMQEHTSLIKRPMITAGKKHLLGFSEADYKQQLLK